MNNIHFEYNLFNVLNRMLPQITHKVHLHFKQTSHQLFEGVVFHNINTSDRTSNKVHTHNSLLVSMFISSFVSYSYIAICFYYVCRNVPFICLLQMQTTTHSIKAQNYCFEKLLYFQNQL